MIATSSPHAANGAAHASVKPIQRAIGSRRLRARASASTTTSSAGASRAAMSSRTAHPGTILCDSTRPACGAEGTSGAASSAPTVLSAALPNPSRRPVLMGASGAGPRSPDACMSTAGTPAASSGPCSPVVSGTARWASWSMNPGDPARTPTCCVIALAAVSASCSGALPSPLEYGMTSGARTLVEATSPSTIAASTLLPVAASGVGVHGTSPLCTRLASFAAPASPPLPPLVETSTTVRFVCSFESTRASSINTAVPESAAREPLALASRCATTTIGLSFVVPGRCATTVVSVRSPSSVAALVRHTRTRNPPPAAPPRPSSVAATRLASALSPALPGARSGNSRLSAWSSSIVHAPSNASGASVGPSGAERLASDSAATATTTSTGTRAARYMRPLRMASNGPRNLTVVAASPRLERPRLAPVAL